GSRTYSTVETSFGELRSSDCAAGGGGCNGTVMARGETGASLGISICGRSGICTSGCGVTTETGGNGRCGTGSGGDTKVTTSGTCATACFSSGAMLNAAYVPATCTAAMA